MDTASEEASNGSELSSHKGAESNERSRVVILIGRVGSGKKTIGNHIAGETILGCESTSAVSSTTRKPGDSYGECNRGGIRYRILTIDTETLQSADVSQILESRNIETVNLILFVLANGLYSDESYELMVSVVKNLPHHAARISALVFTHCELLTKEGRNDLASEFRVEGSKVSAFMGKGIHTVGFPGTFLNPTLKEAIEEAMKEDNKTLHHLVEGSEDAISTTSLLNKFPRLTSSSPPVTESGDKRCSIM